jgi:hypothetical protein
MNLATDRLCANEPDIASKIMDGEAIMINLRTGAYYSLRDAGALAWHAVRGHRTLSEVVQVVAAHYPEDPALLQSDLTDLFARLAEENLLRPADPDRGADAGEPFPSALSGTYQKPHLEKFTDMEELLALDPPTPGTLDGLMRQPIGRRDR